MIRTATISGCETYRYQLMREFEPEDLICGLQGTVLFVLNNPSTADGRKEDPTSRRGNGFTASWGKRRHYFGNCNPWRSTDPKLAQIPPEQILLENDEWLRLMACQADITVAAWGGKANPMLADRALRVLIEVTDVHYLALTNDGAPKHILYLKGDLRPQLWRRAVWRTSQSNPGVKP